MKNLKIIFFIAAALFLLAPNYCIADTSGFCANKWPDDYRMREHCQKQQNKAQRKLFSIAESEGLVTNGSLSASPDGSDKEKIIYNCMTKWEEPLFNTYDYRMVVHCIKQQFESYERTSPGHGKTEGIEGFCANKWPDDYRMRDHCQKQQIEAQRELFSIARSMGIVKEGSLSASSAGEPEERIFYNCMKKWEEARFNTYNYRMVLHCVKKQIDAHEQRTGR